VHAVALVEDQVNVEVPPLTTLVGLERIVTVGAPTVDGAALTVTVADWVALPPMPAQVSV
jgi:hypothetical protein